MLKLLIGFVFAIFINSPAKTQTLSTRNLIFIHGAHFTSMSWDLVRKNLPHLSTFAVDLPGRKQLDNYKHITLDSSAQFFCRYLNSINGKKIIISHSQGGAIVNQSIAQCPHLINSIIYIAAVVPLPQEKPFSLLSEQDEKNYFAGIEYITRKAALKIKDQDKFLQTFAGQATNKQRKIILENAVTEPSKIGDGTLKFNRSDLTKIDKFYFYTLKDKIISYSSQKKITSRINFKKIFKFDSAHLPMVTHPKEIADAISSIAAKDKLSYK